MEDVFSYLNDFLSGFSSQINDFLTSSPLGDYLFWIKLVVGAFCLILVVNIIFLMKKTNYFWFASYRLDAFKTGSFAKRVDKKWGEIEKKILLGDEANLKMALIEADNFFDEILKMMNLPGTSMGERLKMLDVSKLQSINLVWEAHKVRNRIVHQTKDRLTPDEIRGALDKYKKALGELQAV